MRDWYEYNICWRILFIVFRLDDDAMLNGSKINCFMCPRINVGSFFQKEMMLFICSAPKCQNLLENINKLFLNTFPIDVVFEVKIWLKLFDSLPRGAYELGNIETITPIYEQ